MKQYRVFIVEDDDDDFDFLKEALIAYGCTHDIQHFTNADQLLDALSGSSSDEYPDLIVLDHQTPGRNGSDTIHQIRSNKDLDSIAVVIYSSSLPTSLQEKLLAHGADLCKVKGSSAHAILQHVQEFYLTVGKKQRSGKG